jgi:hypothetical protein
MVSSEYSGVCHNTELLLTLSTMEDLDLREASQP